MFRVCRVSNGIAGGGSRLSSLSCPSAPAEVNACRPAGSRSRTSTGLPSTVRIGGSGSATAARTLSMNVRTGMRSASGGGALWEMRGSASRANSALAHVCFCARLLPALLIIALSGAALTPLRSMARAFNLPCSSSAISALSMRSIMTRITSGPLALRMTRSIDRTSCRKA